MSCEFNKNGACKIKQYLAAGGSRYYESYGTACDGPAWSAFCSTKAGSAKMYREAQKQAAYPQSTPKTKGRH